MRNRILTLLFIIYLLPGCSKENSIDTSGTATINNILSFDQKLQTYYSFGFLFSQAKLVSILEVPPPDFTIYSDGTNLSLEANNLSNSFYRFGEYNNPEAAKEVFNNLTSANILQWEGLASPIKPNQIWIYRSGNEHYAKIRIISTVSEIRNERDYGECTFEWVYQPDGTLTFPGK